MEEICLMIPTSGAKFEGKLIFCFKNDKNLVNLIRALNSLKNLHFDWILLCKVYNVRPKKVQRSYISWHWRVMQNLKKNWLVVWKMTWGIWSKSVFSWDPFVQSRKCMGYKLTEELKVMKMKNDEKSEEELTCRLKIDIRNLTNFDLRTQKSQKFTL